MIVAIFSNLPKTLSISFTPIELFEIILSIWFDQAFTLWGGSLTFNLRESSNQPNTIFISLASPSASFLSIEMMSDLDIFGGGEYFWATAWRTVHGAASILSLLLFISTATEIISSIKRPRPIGGHTYRLTWRSEPHMRWWNWLFLQPNVFDFLWRRQLLELLAQMRWPWCSFGI